MDKGPLAAFPLINVEVDLNDGKYHDVDSSDMAFRIASRQAMRQGISKADAVLLEPFMKVQVETPDEYQGFVIGDFLQDVGLSKDLKLMRVEKQSLMLKFHLLKCLVI
jgi:elongation factor G